MPDTHINLMLTIIADELFRTDINPVFCHGIPLRADSTIHIITYSAGSESGCLGF